MALKKDLCFSDNAWSVRPRNPIRACDVTKGRHHETQALKRHILNAEAVNDISNKALTLVRLNFVSVCRTENLEIAESNIRGVVDIQEVAPGKHNIVIEIQNRAIAIAAERSVGVHRKLRRRLRGYPETFSHRRHEIMQLPCGNETQGDRKGRVCAA